MPRSARQSSRMAASPSGTERVSTWAGVIIALIATVTSFVSAVAAVDASQGIADAQRQDAARTEVSRYVVQMSELDRTGGSTHRNEIVTLARQADSLIARHGQRSLNLSASTYRLISLFLALSTTDLELAVRMAHRALELAARTESQGVGGPRMADPLEALQAHRVLADVAAQNLDFDTMSKEFQAALHISETEGGRNRYIDKEARQFTRAYWALDAMMLVDDQESPTAGACAEVRRRADAARKDLEALGKNPEIVRRAKRIEENVCATWVDLHALQQD